MANGFIDTAIALRVLYMLVQPIKELPAYKLGLIGENGEVLRKAKTPEEKAATSMLLRLVMRIRSFLSNIPLAQSKLGSYVSAYALVRECMERDNYLPDTECLTEMHSRIELSDYQVKELLECVDLSEDAPVNSVGGGGVSMPATKRKKATFSVSHETFSKFSKGKAKYKRWGNYLNLENEDEHQIYHYAKKNPKGILVLQDPTGKAKGIRYSKHGGGNWHGIKRKPKQILEAAVESDSYDIEIIDL